MATYTRTGYIYYNFYYDGTQYTRFRIAYTQTEDSVAGTYKLKITGFAFTSTYRYRWTGSVSNLYINGNYITLGGNSFSGHYLSSLGGYDALSISANPAEIGPFKYSDYPNISSQINYSFTPIDGGQYLSGTATGGTTTGGSIGITQIHSHSYTSSYKAPTCIATGGTTYTCSCGHSYTNVEPATGIHTYSAATCTSAPRCTACGTVSGSALGHNYAEATCTAPQTCARCGATVGSALGHNYTAASCTSPAVCIRCNTNSGSALGHSYSSSVVAPTCTAEGYTLYACIRCSEHYTNNPTAKTAHEYDGGIVTTQPTTSQTGIKTFTCYNCGTTKTESIPVLSSNIVFGSRVGWINSETRIVPMVYKGNDTWVRLNPYVADDPTT